MQRCAEGHREIIVGRRVLETANSPACEERGPGTKKMAHIVCPWRPHVASTDFDGLAPMAGDDPSRPLRVSIGPGEVKTLSICNRSTHRWAHICTCVLRQPSHAVVRCHNNYSQPLFPRHAAFPLLQPSHRHGMTCRDRSDHLHTLKTCLSVVQQERESSSLLLRREPEERRQSDFTAHTHTQSHKYLRMKLMISRRREQVQEPVLAFRM